MLQQFSTLADGLIFKIITWNVNAKIYEEPLPNEDGEIIYSGVEELLKDSFAGQTCPDVIVIGLQEMIELNASNVVGSSVGLEATERVNKWKTAILSTLTRTSPDYKHLASNQLVGLWLGVYVRESCAGIISGVQTSIYARGTVYYF